MVEIRRVEVGDAGGPSKGASVPHPIRAPLAALCTTTARPACAAASNPSATCSTTALDVPEASYVTAFHGSSEASGPSAPLSHQCPSTADADAQLVPSCT